MQAAADQAQRKAGRAMAAVMDAFENSMPAASPPQPATPAQGSTRDLGTPR